MRRLFISDLHLSESRPQLTRAFFSFLENYASNAQELYILGDFFDAWIGDDDDHALAFDISQALLHHSNQGLHIFFMHGNRDFLIGEDYARRCGAIILPEGQIINIAGKACLLLHGDSLCIDDTDYQHFRAMVRNPQWQAQILTQPLAVRRTLAAQMREKSKSMSSLKRDDIVDVNRQEVGRVMSQAHVNLLIHGHTHRPARHSLLLQGLPAERIVLGDWDQQAWCLIGDELTATLELISWDI